MNLRKKLLSTLKASDGEDIDIEMTPAMLASVSGGKGSGTAFVEMSDRKTWVLYRL